MNHLPYARTLLESVRRHHGETPVVVAVVDAPSREAVRLGDAIVLTGEDLFGAEFGYAALKFRAFELCCAAKPFMLGFLLEHSPATRFVYLDSDVYLFSPLDALFGALDSANFVVTPHTLAPIPSPERFWERPRLPDLEYAGFMNAGLFAMRRGDDAGNFISAWMSMVSSPGANVDAGPRPAEQNAFNWVTSFSDSVRVLRDTAYNVAYWNLHDRTIRFEEEGDGGEGRWLVDRRPLVAFHFSGFSIREPHRLSAYENRYSLYTLPAVGRLCEFYSNRVLANDRGELDSGYAFDKFPSGIRIDDRMRLIFKQHEAFLRREVSPWTSEGESWYARALLSPVPYTGSLAPILMKAIVDVRPDLRILGDSSLSPERLIEWMFSGGVHDYEYEALVDRHRPAVPTAFGADMLVALHARDAQLFAGLDRAVSWDRREFIDRIRVLAPIEAAQVASGTTEQFIVSGIRAIRQLMTARSDLAAAFPDPLFDDAESVIAWLWSRRLVEHYLPVEAIDAFQARVRGASLARIYSYLSRSWGVMEAWPLALVGVHSDELSRMLLCQLQYNLEFDLEDVEMFLWTTAATPWKGLALTLELPIHTTQHPSSLSREGQDEILAPVLSGDERFRKALMEYRESYPTFEDRAPRSRRSTADISVFAVVSSDFPVAPQRRREVVAPGANVIGFHRSDIGLGQMTRGLTEALHSVGCETSPVVLSNVRMDADLRPDDFIRRFALARGTNIFVSYPHLRELLIRMFPDALIDGHRNIAYLAWEQRGGSPYWERVYADYDQVWALSDFAAESLSATLRRTVSSVPCVVDLAGFAPPASKELHGIEADRFTFLFIYDANSSTERKYPEAVVAAFRTAFRDDDRVRLIIKASSGDRIETRVRLQRVIAVARSCSNVEVRAEDLSRKDLYGLISACDCYVSLHRSEGFGYTCAEAMAYGKPVIATGYSGNMQFMNEVNSYPVRYREIEATVSEGPFQRGSIWAEPDVRHAAELMRYVFENRDEAAAKGLRGRGTIESELSPAAIGKRVASLLGAS